MTITTEAWLAELEAIAAKSTDGDGMTVSEMADASGRGVLAIRNMLRRAIAGGKWEMSGKRAGKAIDGRSTFIPCYRPVVNPSSTEAKMESET